MANKHSTLTSLFSDIADTIRSKTGSTENIIADDFPVLIDNIDIVDVSAVTATAADVISGKVFVDKDGNPVNGTLVVQTYYRGASSPPSDLGMDNDLYFVMG